MAGFFGLFNYEKAGPGVSKNEKEKRGVVRFFEIYFRNFWKLTVISFFYDLLCIPVLSHGLARVGITNVTRNISREKHSFGVSDFFDTVKKNWKSGLLSGIINIVLAFLLFFDVWFFMPRGEESGILDIILTGVTFFLIISFVVMQYYIPMLIITFSLKLKDVYKNAFKFVFINFKRNIVITLGLAAFLAIVVFIMYFGDDIGLAASMLIMAFVYPSFSSYLIQYNIFDCIRKYMIDPYYAEHPDADIEKRLALGLPVPEEYLPSYDALFDDETQSQRE